VLSKLLLAGAIFAVLAFPGVAAATPASGLLQGANGEGSFNPTLPCGTGDGPNWRYAWIDQAASSPGDVLGGEWDGSFEVHDAGTRGGNAFIPNNDGRLSITVDRGGSGFFETLGDGSCDNATLALAGVAEGEPVVSGTLPIIARGGTGALKGLTGSGIANFRLQLGPGADNAAEIAIDGDFDVTGPQLAPTVATSRWQNLTAWFGRRLTVTVTVANPLTAGHAFDARIGSVAGGTGSFSGVPTGAGTIAPGASRSYSFDMNGAQPGSSYTLAVTVTAKDGLLAADPPTTGSVTFKAPLLP